MSRILVFSPYTSMTLHANYETTIARGCQLRGAEIKYVLCDGALAECDVHYGAKTGAGRPFDMCTGCKASARASLEAAGLSYDWLSKHVDESERRAIFDWAQSLSPSEFLGATYNGQPIGEWIISSVASYFRVHEIDFEDWSIVGVARGYLQAAAFACVALTRLMDEWKPDALFIFNGRMSVLRVALNLARQRGIRVLVHERPFGPDAVTVIENATCLSPLPFKGFWKAWGGVPLTKEQFNFAVTWIQDRRYQRSGNDMHCATTPEGSGNLRRKLGLEPGRKLAVLFTSSTDEYLGETDCPSAFESQEEWIEQVIAWAARRPDHDLVVRAHPCLSGKATHVRATRILAWFEALAARLPANVRLILPDDPLSSYDLMELADIGLCYCSTAGIEILALGKPLILAASIAHYHPLDEVMLLQKDSNLEAVLDHAITLPPSRERRRAAFRFIYRRYSHMQVHFPLVALEGPWKTVLTYESSDALKPGADAGLDSICEFLLTGKPVFADPDSAALQTCREEEDALHAALETNPVWYQAQPVVPPLSERLKRAVVFCVKPVYKATKPVVRPLERMMQNLERRIGAS